MNQTLLLRNVRRREQVIEPVRFDDAWIVHRPDIALYLESVRRPLGPRLRSLEAVGMLAPEGDRRRCHSNTGRGKLQAQATACLQAGPYGVDRLCWRRTTVQASSRWRAHGSAAFAALDESHCCLPRRRTRHLIKPVNLYVLPTVLAERTAHAGPCGERQAACRVGNRRMNSVLLLSALVVAPIAERQRDSTIAVGTMDFNIKHFRAVIRPARCNALAPVR